MYISTSEIYFLSGGCQVRQLDKRCIFQVKRCRPILQLQRCVISGGRHLENEMYISSGKMYISTGEMYHSYLVTARYIWRSPDRNICLTS